MKKIKLSIDDTTSRHVKNPKTTAQTLQRILIKVVGVAYAKVLLKTVLRRLFSFCNRYKKFQSFADTLYLKILLFINKEKLFLQKKTLKNNYYEHKSYFLFLQAR